MISTIYLPVRHAAVAVGLALCAWGVQADALRTETVASGLEHPWALAFLPGSSTSATPSRARAATALPWPAHA